MNKKTCGGIDYVTPKDFKKNLIFNLEQLRQSVIIGNYKATPVRRVFIPKMDGSKRPLGIPIVSDRIVQIAVFKSIEQMFEKSFMQCNYAYRIGRKTKDAIQAVDNFRMKGYSWVVIADIEDYFNTVNHSFLVHLLKRKIRDKRVIRLIIDWLKAGVMYKRRISPTNKGLAQGGAISPLLANIYLHYLDSAMVRKGDGIIRFADDIIIMCRTKKEAKKSLKFCEKILSRKLKLKLKSSKSHISNFEEGFDFLGIHFQKDYKKISGKKMQYFQQRVNYHIKKRSNSYRDIIYKLDLLVMSWKAYYLNIDSQTFPQLVKIEDKIQDTTEKLSVLDREKYAFNTRAVFSVNDSKMMHIEGGL